MKRWVFHVDVNSAFLSWEAAYRQHHLGERRDLRRMRAAVAGDAALRRGIILAKSIPAGEYGVKTGDSIPEARQKCPHLLLVPPNYGLYEKCSRAFLEILREYSPRVEQYSIDEAYVDMTEVRGRWEDPLIPAREMGARIRRELGFTVNIGVAENKLLAKMAGDFQKPDRVHTLFREEIERKLWPLPVDKLFFVGPAAASKLKKLGIGTVGELAVSDPGVLRLHLKKQGEVIWQFANGWDDSPVLAEAPPNKGYGNSTTIPFDVTRLEEAQKVLLGLAETLGARLRTDGMRVGVISVSLCTCGFIRHSRQRILESPTDITWEIYRRAEELFRALWDGMPVRQLGIHTGKAQRAAGTFRQLRLFDPTDYEKLGKAERAVDEIRRRYGMDAVKRAVFLRGPIDHMSGGISREKRSADYDSGLIKTAEGGGR